MADTSIEWADSVWNPVVGCTPVSAGCLNCYAATMARRHVGMGTPGYEDRGGVRIAETRGGRAVFTGSVRCLPDRIAEPLRWRKPRRIFVCSMADLFHEAVPVEFIDRVFAVAALCPQHQFLVLTKRPERMAEYLASFGAEPRDEAVRRLGAEAPAMEFTYEGGGFADLTVEEALRETLAWPLPNVWLGTSVEDQAAADERIPHLLRCPAAVRFLSVEPLLGPVDLTEVPTRRAGASDSCRMRDMLHWVIVGGESGAKARACDVAHVESVRDQCAAAGVACFIKQLGLLCGYTNPRGDIVRRWGDVSVAPYEDGVCLLLNDRKGADPSEWPADLRVRQMPEVRR